MRPAGNAFLGFIVQAPDWLFGRLLRCLHGLWAILQWIMEAFRHFRVGRLLALGVCAGLALAAFQIVPPVYGRFALAQEAATAARRSTILGQEKALRKLTGAAFKLGFTEVALAPDTFKLEFSHEDGVDLATVSYDFVHEIDLCGVAKLPLRVQDQVVKPTMPVPKAADPEASVD